MEELFMQENSFDGSLPSSLCSMRAIRILDLAQNNFSGRIPSYLENLSSLQILNLSFNSFEDEVPLGGVFKNITAVSLTGNDQLCGGDSAFHLPLCRVVGGKHQKRSNLVKIIVPLVLGIILILFILFWVFLYRLKKMRKQPSSELPTLASVLQVSYDSLLKATDGFSPSNLIGVGGYGTVYKGNLEEFATPIAVKVLNLQRRGANKSFLSKCEALRNIRHRNLVKILSACASIDFHGNEFKALIYEFMVNGSLENWLYPQPQDSSKRLGFLRRLNISIDVGLALDYLHNQCETAMVHCDLKPSNILLDHNMTGHVADFGLARFINGGEEEKELRKAETETNRFGTIGYAAPEYGVQLWHSIVREIFCKRRPTDELFKDGLDLAGFAKAALPDRLMEIVDPILVEEAIAHSNSNSQGSSNIKACLAFITGIGVACCEYSPKGRMVISNAIIELQNIRSNFLLVEKKNIIVPTASHG